jgi:hypothetical protein
MRSHLLGKIFPALAMTSLILSCPAHATDVPVASFGNWKIIYVTDNTTYNLIGPATGPVGGSFTLQCHPEKGAASLLIPIWTQDLKPYRESILHIMVWSDVADAREIELLVSRGILAVDANSASRRSDNVPIFVGILADAKAYFAFSFLGRTFEFDAKFLKVARQKFSDECAKLVAR